MNEFYCLNIYIHIWQSILFGLRIYIIIFVFQKRMTEEIKQNDTNNCRAGFLKKKKRNILFKMFLIIKKVHCPFENKK